MPDSPGTEGRRGPPPVPAAAREDRAHATSPPGPAQVAELIELAGREATAGGAAGGEAGVRAALLAWVIGGERAASRRVAETVDVTHPLAAAVALLHAQTEPQSELLELVERALPAAGPLVAQMARELAETWLLRVGDAGRAARVAGSFDQPDLAALALAIGSEWRELAELLAAAATNDPWAAVDAASVYDDRLGEVEPALGVLAHAKAGAAAAGLVHRLELAAAAPLDVDAQVTLRRAHLAAASEDPAEKTVAALALCEALGRAGSPAEGEALLTGLVGDAEVAQRVLLIARRQNARARGALPQVAALALEHARALGDGPLGLALLRRAAAIHAARTKETQRAEALWAELAEATPADPGALRAGEQLASSRDDAAAWAALLEAQAAHAPAQRAQLVGRAATLVEAKLKDPARALAMRAALDTGPFGALTAARLHLGLGDRAKAIASLRKAAAALAAVPRAAAALMSVVGLAELAAGQAREAEEALRDAAKRHPADVVTRAALAELFRRSSRWRDLAEALGAIVEHAGDPALRARALAELGRVTATRLGDPKAARAKLEQAMELTPDDVGVISALAELAGEASDWPRAIELRGKIAKLTTGAQALAAELQIAEIEAQHRKDDVAAAAALERTLARHGDKAAAAALVQLGALHRKHKRTAELADVMRRELGVIEDPQRQLALHLELARLAEGEGDLVEAADRYREALGIEPGHAAALAAFERLVRKEARWDALAEVFSAAPRSVRNARVLGEAYEKLGRFAELAQARATELELTDDPRTKARLATALAELTEEKLGDVDAAAALYEQALAADASDNRPRKALAKMFEKHAQHARLAATLEAELLALGPSARGAERIALLVRLGELRRGPLADADGAVRAYEDILTLEPGHQGALDALEAIETERDRPAALVAVLERKANLVQGGTRAELLARVAELRAEQGDAGASFEALRDAFAADPSNRGTFTALEKLCYKSERWADVMALYGQAIELVERGASRAYRLGDLYARKGGVELQHLNDPVGASQSYRQVLTIDPDNDNALKFLESIAAQQGEWRPLLEVYEQRAAKLGDDVRRLETLRRAARVAAAKLKDHAAAAALYGRILQMDGSDQEALDALERHHEREGRFEDLLGILSRRVPAGIAEDPSKAVAALMRIAQVCEEQLRDDARATDAYRRILELSPQHREALDALSRIYESTEKWAEFVDITRRQIRITNDRAVKALMYFKCGSVMESKFGKEDDAIRYYDAAIKTSPSCLPAVHGLRDLYLRKKEWARVIQTLEIEIKLWQEDKERAGVYAQIGNIYGRELADEERALHYYESALAVDPGCLPANRALFELFFNRGEWQRAASIGQQLAQRAVREGEPAERSEFYRRLGVVTWHTGDPRSAAEGLVIALEIRPENQAALDDLARLARSEPDAYDFIATFRELEKIYRKREQSEALLARVFVAQATQIERTGDLDEAERRYREALALAPDDLGVLSALVDLHVNMRRWQDAAAVITDYLGRKPQPAVGERVTALMRLAEIHADGEMDAARAAKVYGEVLKLDGDNQEAHYRIAQEQFALGQYAEARQHIEKLIQLAAAPGAQLSPTALARYYYYMGRISEAMGDSAKAQSQHRRAAEYDPSHAPTALALARRAAQSGDRRTAETRLIEAAHAAMEKGGARAAVPMQRGLARILLAAGEKAQAIEAYRGILAVEPGSAEDRVALAEIYAMDDLARAATELQKVLDRDLRAAPAYRLLIHLYERLGDAERALRVSSVLELLGYMETEERELLAQARAAVPFAPRRATLPDELRRLLLLPPAARTPVGELWSLVAEEIAALYQIQSAGDNLQLASELGDLRLTQLLTEAGQLFGITPEIYVGDNVWRDIILIQFPQPVIVMSRKLLDWADADRRFVLGRAFEALRGGYAPLLRLSPSERANVGALLRSLSLPEPDRPPTTAEFARSLQKRTQKGLERFIGMASSLDVEGWFAALAEAQDRAGLLASDDFAAAARAAARLSGEELAVGEDGAVALGAVPGGADLLRYYLSEDYHRLRQALGEPLAS